MADEFERQQALFKRLGGADLNFGGAARSRVKVSSFGQEQAKIEAERPALPSPKVVDAERPEKVLVLKSEGKS